ncbi:mas-related G-protein coupled receptor member H-like [Carettochelys insculpta]|uniref:mas-related G-protein coupled receptor member H-like n=1 Tax=Carettochelys insculpta TaxID=44489 RepID=UPI003EBF1EC7
MTEPNTTCLPPTETSFSYSDTNHRNECTRISFTGFSIYSVTLLICLLGLLGNGMVLWFFGFCIQRNPFTVYILNLGMADFGFLLLLAVFLTTEMVNILNCFHLDLSLFALLFLFTYNTSLYLLTAISIERCLAVFFPLWCQCHCPKHLSAIVCFLLWVLSSLLIGLVHYFCVSSVTAKCPMTFLPMHILNLLICIPIMVLSSVTLSIKVQCCSQQRQQRKLYAIILLIVLFFLLFAIPLSIQLFAVYFSYAFFSIEICFTLASINSSSNPFIYFLVGSYKKRQFRGSVKVVLQAVFEEKADTRETHREDQC